MADTILRGYTYSRPVARYRDISTGRFVARERILSLLDSQIASAESRLGAIVTAMHQRTLAPGMGQMLMRDEVRRLHLQNAALAKGGFDRLNATDYGRAGRQLRDTYQRMTNLANGIQAGEVTLPQALNRVAGYVGEARRNFLVAEREALQATGQRMEARRRLGVAEHCVDCVNFARMGWLPIEFVPLPGEASVCGVRCKCHIEYRTAEAIAA